MSREAETMIQRFSSERYRQVFGHLPTGVTVVTAWNEEGPVGMAANAITSLSIDPPLLALCIAHSSTTWPSIRDTGSFCVNVLAEGQDDLCRKFAQKGIDRFHDAAVVPRTSGPALTEAVAWIDCTIQREVEAGDHSIVIAEITDMELSGAPSPLIFYRGQFARIASEDVERPAC